MLASAIASRLLPRTMVPKLASRGLSTIVMRPTTTGTALLRAVNPSQALPVRSYGTRSMWNVPKGRFWFVSWTGGIAFVWVFAHEFLAPYVLFHS
eukprot:NODE_26916_length_532_cov_14.096296.p3 GENE.NODE_26916_length_532_cov_14.096296~~NODE_26916_length_532_cov_14.096296.p3  ORF type:complete len:95 (+),score=10.77 NODE_26916_length_532_cov_14.096296:92-376(+)